LNEPSRCAGQSSEDSDVCKELWRILRQAYDHLRTNEALLILSVFVLLIVWGPKGEPLFTPWLKNWIDAQPLDAGFRLQLLSFASGVVLLVCIPILIIRFGFKQPLSKFGLGRGNSELGLKVMLLAFAIGIPLYFAASRLPVMWDEYPLLYRGLTTNEIVQRFTWSQFVVYELLYFAFFLVIEFSFRGYMLFGLESRFGAHTILIQMLPYTIWHLSKPVPELLGTPLWGLVTGALGLRVRSVWYIVTAHWVLNVFLDTMILIHRGVIQWP
jgi:uncharacterized protein